VAIWVAKTTKVALILADNWIQTRGIVSVQDKKEIHMVVSPANANSGSNYVSQVQPQPQTQAERATEVENDKDSDDARKAAAVNPQPQPTVNTSGQTVGTIINVKA
jgi:hypothetical protein